MQQKLYLLILGCTPPGRHTEQHDVFFGIGSSLKELLPAMHLFWNIPTRLHIDSWREVNVADSHHIEVVPRHEASAQTHKLFFLNLGGYKPGDPEEYHYKMLVVAGSTAEAIKKAKASAFYRHTGFQGAESHIDDKYGVDVDDVHEIDDVLDPHSREKFGLKITPIANAVEDAWHVGYLKISDIEKNAL